MRKNQGKALIGVMITMLITIFLLPMSVFAATSGKFILVAEADGELIFAPEYVTYTDNQTIGEVLENSKYNFIIENGNVTKVQILIDGASDVVYKKTIDLSRPLEWNATLLEVK